MSDTKTELLTSAGTLGGTEYVHIVQGGNSRKVALSDLAQYIKTAATIVPTNLPYRGARVSRSTNQSIATGGGLTIISWSAAARDTGSFWSSGAPTRLTVPTGVTKVQLSAGVRWDVSTTGIRQATFQKNGASFPGGGASVVPGPAASANIVQNIKSDVVDVVAGDYFEAGVFQTSGAALNVMTHDTTWFAISVVEVSGS